MDIKIITTLSTIILASIGVATLLIQNEQYAYAVSCFTLTILTIIYGIYKYFNIKRKSEKDNVETTKKTEVSLKNHIIFSDLQEMKLNIRVMDFGCNHKAKILANRDYQHLRIITIQDILHKNLMLRNKEILCEGGCGWIQEKIIETIKLINDKAREISLPEIYINKMMSYFQDALDTYMRLTSKICQSKLGDSCYSKLISHLYVLDYICAMTIIDSEKAIGQLNGALESKLDEINYSEKRKEFITKYDLVRE